MSLLLHSTPFSSFLDSKNVSLDPTHGPSLGKNGSCFALFFLFDCAFNSVPLLPTFNSVPFLSFRLSCSDLHSRTSSLRHFATTLLHSSQTFLLSHFDNLCPLSPLALTSVKNLTLNYDTLYHLILSILSPKTPTLRSAFDFFGLLSPTLVSFLSQTE